MIMKDIKQQYLQCKRCGTKVILIGQQLASVDSKCGCCLDSLTEAKSWCD